MHSSRVTRRRGAAVALALTLLLAALAMLPPAASDEAEGITDAYVITTDSASPPTPFEAFDASSVGVFDLDGDGVAEILAHNDNNRAYVFDGGSGALVAELTTNHPKEWDARELNGISVGDVNGNGLPDVVVANSVGWVTAFEVRAAAEPSEPMRFEKLWERFVDPTEMDPDFFENHPQYYADWDGFPGLDGAAYLGDADGDGRDEAFLQTDNVPSHFGLEDDGSVRWWTNWSDGNGNPVVDDLDGNGKLEAVFASDGGQVFVYDAASGSLRCKFVSKDHGVMPASISVSPTTADVTGDGKKEIVFGARQAVEDPNDPEWMMKQHAMYFAVSSGCHLVWKQTYEWGNPHLYMHPAVVDVNGDGRMDVVFQDWNTIGHKPGNWEPTGKSNLFAVNGATGEALWRIAVDTYWSNKDIAIADVTGDGEPEILVVAPRGGASGITLVSLAGHVTGFIGAGDGWDVTRGPAVADVNGDGTLEVLFPVHREADHCARPSLDVGCRAGAIRIFHTGVEAEPVWDGVFVYSHAYDNERKPRSASLPSFNVTQADAPIGDLAVRVQADVPIASVHAQRVDGDGWVELAAAGDGVYSSTMDEAARSHEKFRVRVLTEDGRAAASLIEWVGKGDGRIDGIVLDGGGDPLAGANVTIERDGTVVHDAVTADDGVFSFTTAPGLYRVTAEKEGYESLTREVVVKAGEPAPADMRLHDAGMLSNLPSTVPGLAVAAGLLGMGVVALVAGIRRRAR